MHREAVVVPCFWLLPVDRAALRCASFHMYGTLYLGQQCIGAGWGHVRISLHKCLNCQNSECGNEHIGFTRGRQHQATGPHDNLVYTSSKLDAVLRTAASAVYHTHDVDQ
jgi:hypothetical protein